MATSTRIGPKEASDEYWYGRSRARPRQDPRLPLAGARRAGRRHPPGGAGRPRASCSPPPGMPAPPSPTSRAWPGCRSTPSTPASAASPSCCWPCTTWRSAAATSRRGARAATTSPRSWRRRGARAKLETYAAALAERLPVGRAPRRVAAGGGRARPGLPRGARGARRAPRREHAPARRRPARHRGGAPRPHRRAGRPTCSGPPTAPRSTASPPAGVADRPTTPRWCSTSGPARSSREASTRHPIRGCSAPLVTLTTAVRIGRGSIEPR